MGDLHSHDPEDLHTKIANGNYIKGLKSQLWENFLNTTFNNNTDLIEYMQRLAGLSALGDIHEHILVFCYGSGGNGKTVFLESLAHTLGEYATTAPSSFLMVNRFEGHPTEIARLRGTRFVICSEVNEDDRFDEAKVKILTGGDKLTARFMNKDFFTFEPSHTLWMMGNHQPDLLSGGESIRRRIRLIPFTATIPEEQKIDNLLHLFKTEHRDAILTWIIDGMNKYLENGIETPEMVLAATDEYISSTDTVGRFLDEMCHYGQAVKMMATKASVVREAYEQWCSQAGERPIKGRALAQHFSRHGVLVGRKAPQGTGGVRMYGGIGLISNDNSLFGKED